MSVYENGVMAVYEGNGGLRHYRVPWEDYASLPMGDMYVVVRVFLVQVPGDKANELYFPAYDLAYLYGEHTSITVGTRNMTGWEQHHETVLFLDGSLKMNMVLTRAVADIRIAAAQWNARTSDYEDPGYDALLTAALAIDPATSGPPPTV